jgi:hypothetical protein
VTVPDDDVRPASDGNAEAEASAASETADAAGQSPAAPPPAETPPVDPPPADPPPAETPPADQAPADPPPTDPPPGMGVTPIADTGDECHTHTGRAGGQAADAGAESGPGPTADPLDADPSAAESPLDEAQPGEAQPREAQPGEAPPGESQLGEALPGEAQPGEAPPGEPPPTALAESQIAAVLAGLTSVDARMGELAAAATELARLRTRDTDLIARLHDDVTRLRTGEIAAALHPVVIGMIKLHDQMVSLGALSDPASPVGMLHTQLLQTMELTCGVKPFSPAAGERFDSARHSGIRRIATTEESADGTIAGTVKAGFARSDGSVVRVAEVEVHRLQG